MRLIDTNALKVRMFRSKEFNYETGRFDLPVVPWHDIEDADTIDAVPVVHGRWKTHFYSNCVDTYGNPDTCAECSECGFRWHSVREAKSWFHYCPDCGAKMDGKEDEEWQNSD